jgi:hypothetical protein
MKKMNIKKIIIYEIVFLSLSGIFLLLDFKFISNKTLWFTVIICCIIDYVNMILDKKGKINTKYKKIFNYSFFVILSFMFARLTRLVFFN